MEGEEDLDTLMAKLIDQATRYNIERYEHALQTKVKNLPFGPDLSLTHSFHCVYMLCISFVSFLQWFSFFQQTLLVEAVSYKWSYAEVYLTSIEIDAKVFSIINLLILFFFLRKCQFYSIGWKRAKSFLVISYQLAFI